MLHFFILRSKFILKNPAIFANDVNHKKFAVNLKSCILQDLANTPSQAYLQGNHRIGQTKSVFAYKMICKDTIEEKIIQLQQRKKELSDNLIGDNEGFVKQLSKEDVEFLFG